jgi:recombination protein RecA
MSRKKKDNAETNDGGLVSKLVEKFGESILPDVRGDTIEAVSLGSLSLDVATGIGGIPKGRFTEIYGPEGTGKTTLALQAAMNEVQNGNNVLYIDAENLLSYGVISSMFGGVTVDKGKLILLQPKTAEEGFMIVEDALNELDFSLIVIDSLAAMLPGEEARKEFDESSMMVMPRLLSHFLKRNQGVVNKKNTAVLLLNQVRDKVGSYTGGYTSPGGHALKHHTALIIALYKGGEIKNADRKVGVNTKFNVVKNKMNVPFVSWEFPIIFGTGVDYHLDTVLFAEGCGVVSRSGAFYKFGDITLGQGSANAADYLRENKEVLDKIVEKVYNIYSQKE